MVKLSIIIVSYNTKDYLQKALQSIEESSDKLQKEIIVVDNGSEDQSQSMVINQYPAVRLITSTKNLGFSAGNNLGIKAARGEYVLLLNSDTKIFPDTLEKMIKFMDSHPDVGVATCAVILASGQPDPASHRGFPTPWSSLTYFLGLEKLFPRSRLFSSYHQGWKDLQTVHEIDTPAGAFYLTRKKILHEVGLLDENFFMYAEDIDLSLRIKKAGWKIMYVPITKIIHYKKKSGRQAPGKELRQQTSSYFFTTMKLFYDKHYCHQYPAIVRWFTLTGIWIISKFRK